MIYLNKLVLNVNITNECLMKLINLKYLNLGDNCKISDHSLIKLVNLTSLIIGKNNSQITDYSIKQLTKLTHLDLGISMFISGDCISKLHELTYLEMSCYDSEECNISNKFKDDDFRNLTKLTSLGLYSYEVTNGIFKYLNNLTELRLNYINHITIDGICQLTNLKLLTLGYCLPQNMCNTQTNTKLSFYFNN